MFPPLLEAQRTRWGQGRDCRRLNPVGRRWVLGLAIVGVAGAAAVWLWVRPAGVEPSRRTGHDVRSAASVSDLTEHHDNGKGVDTRDDVVANSEEVLIVQFAGRYGIAWLVFDLEGKYLSYF